MITRFIHQELFCDWCGLNSDKDVHTPNCKILAAEKAIALAEGREAPQMREIVPVECWKILDAPQLDPIHVFWINHSPGQGYVTNICYGQARTAYFGAMSGKTIQAFFAGCDTQYLVNAMGIRPLLKQTKSSLTYLARIVDAVKKSIAEAPNA